MSIDAIALYKKMKLGAARYNEKAHCSLVLEVMERRGSVASFCREAMIGDRTFYMWLHRHPLFNECYRLGYMMALDNWECEGKAGKDDPDFNMRYWEKIGETRFRVGKIDKVRMSVDAEANPYEQYKQLVEAASLGDYTASEIKQMMESINVGNRVYESYKLQEEVDTMKKDLQTMRLNSGNNIIPIASATKTN